MSCFFILSLGLDSSCNLRKTWEVHSDSVRNLWCCFVRSKTQTIFLEPNDPHVWTLGISLKIQIRKSPLEKDVNIHPSVLIIQNHYQKHIEIIHVMRAPVVSCNAPFENRIFLQESSFSVGKCISQQENHFSAVCPGGLRIMSRSLFLDESQALKSI